MLILGTDGMIPPGEWPIQGRKVTKDDVGNPTPTWRHILRWDSSTTAVPVRQADVIARHKSTAFTSILYS